jgi:hypothetical protein
VQMLRGSSGPPGGTERLRSVLGPRPENHKVKFEVAGGRKATEEEVSYALRRAALLSGELQLVRSTALAWRNGAAAGVAGLLGFGLIRGRSDIADLARPFSIAAGCLLMLAIGAGGFSAFLFLRAAHGGLSEVPIDASEEEWDHLEAQASLSAVKRGIRFLILGLALLFMSVAFTWYGPPAEGPYLRIATRTAPSVDCA